MSLKRHKNSFHTEMSTKYQCWNCLNTYVRKENVLKHSRQRHNDNDNKYIIVEMKNKKYNLQINRPAKWVPLPEARPKQGTTYRITIPAIKPKMQPKQQGESLQDLISSYQSIVRELKKNSPIWGQHATREIDEQFQTKVTDEMLLEDLALSDSNTSICSQDTICQDEIDFDFTPINNVRVYNAFQNTSN